MADNLLLNDNNNDGVGGDDDIFVYTGGEQEVPFGVKRVRIAESVDTIPARLFEDCDQLIEVEGHNRLWKIERSAFYGCRSLRSVLKMTGLIEIEDYAFYDCHALRELEFDKLEIIGHYAFAYCKSSRTINMPSIRRVGRYAFQFCEALTDAVFGQDLERIEAFAFLTCIVLKRISIPLKYGLIIGNNALNYCENLSRVDVVDGGMHETISSLHLESWRVEMLEEIDSINQTLPTLHDYSKTHAIEQWITRNLGRMEHYKTEHQILLKEAMALLELALWKARLLNETDDEKKCSVDDVAKKAKIDAEAVRKEHRVTCGASIVIKNVLPFLALK